jgi:hypothetical protein
LPSLLPRLREVIALSRTHDSQLLTMSASDKNSTKGDGVVGVNDAASDGGSSTRVDAAWKYLDTNRDVNDTTDGEPVDLAALRRKIDWHIVPLMFLCYTLQFLDKVILNVRGCPPPHSPAQTPHDQRLICTIRAQYAAVMGIQKDLNLVGNDFSNIATFLFVGLLCFEIPNSKTHDPINPVEMGTRGIWR